MSDDTDPEKEEEPPPEDKPLFWLGSSRDDLSAFPLEVKRVMGFALRQAQQGGKHIHAKPLKGFKGAGVLEVVADHATNTYRGVYTVRFRGAVYVLHAFQKKSKSGIKTPKPDLDQVERRLKLAKEHYESWSQSEGEEGGGGSDPK
ncbi:MAG: type II toxin-antitoxin system RelE/ParE family toxin [Gemmataceae bacterium]|nr:type II toxin-antitoxin system RelE/ParE family toxin [Gemmataceae bacterium]